MSYFWLKRTDGFDLCTIENPFGAGSRLGLVPRGPHGVLARVRWDGRERWYAVAQHGDLILNTQKCPSRSADEAKAVALRWLRERGVVS
jgi:hypothetical protein